MEKEIKEAFVTAFNRLVTEREEIVTNARLVRQTLCDTTALMEEKIKLQQELAVLVEMTEKCIRENARIAQSQEEYQRSYEGLVVRYDVAKARFDEVLETISVYCTQGCGHTERRDGVKPWQNTVPMKMVSGNVNPFSWTDPDAGNCHCV